ncbi:carnitine O-acetyltransferase-like [Plectropomus leopardus]|uniref:carnitine O-acetyltransferase-like n=1 Tax=Plectropomus leopardus TaxID=160734 RepID=UPI001C4A93E5|nr:carnitine O-acetyltransferase-like [Plectropomus leopardus]
MAAADKTNKDSLSAIQSSIFVVCLDGATPTVSDEMYHSSAFLQILHGGGSQLFSGNRWFDKGFQVIIGEDGTYGLTGSNTTADVTVGATICAYVGACMKKLHVMQSPVEPLPQPQKLHFNLTPEIKKDIEEAKQHIDRLAQDLEMKTVMFDHFGKNAIKALKMNPNAFMQMALQLAFYRTFHQIQPMLDVITLRMFRLGRASFININTPASVAFVKVFDDPETQKSEKFDLLEKAIKAHEHYTDMALRGQDAFCHLQGLKMQALEEKISVPDIFTDTSFQKAFDYKVVASQIVHSSGCVLCFGPEGPGQYVLIHGIMSNHIEFVVASLETCKEYNAAHMAHALQDALCDIRNLLEQTTRAKISLLLQKYVREQILLAVAVIVKRGSLDKSINCKSIFHEVGQLISSGNTTVQTLACSILTALLSEFSSSSKTSSIGLSMEFHGSCKRLFQEDGLRQIFMLTMEVLQEFSRRENLNAQMSSVFQRYLSLANQVLCWNFLPPNHILSMSEADRECNTSKDEPSGMHVICPRRRLYPSAVVSSGGGTLLGRRYDTPCHSTPGLTLLGVVVRPRGCGGSQVL